MSRKRKRLTGVEALDAAYAAVDHQPLCDAFGVDIPEELLKLALTHRSFANENDMLPNNERLEFLGDAVLGLSVAGQLYLQYPTLPESDISKMRASVVSRYGLSDVAREIDLGPHLLLGKGEEQSDGRSKDSILADTMEALIGAVYLTHGFDAARAAVLRLFQHKIDISQAVGIHMDWKTTLQERLAEKKLPMAEYQWQATGLEHEKVFTAQAVVLGEVLGHGKGANKKTAEQQSAQEAVQRLQDDIALVQRLVANAGTA